MTRPSSTIECIRLRGVRQNNLKAIDLDLPLGRYIAVTGLSGAGKSSLVFDTLHAEGQRRYVETFSAYTRQFLDLLAQPKADSIENIRPSIAIRQTNTVKTSRSTVGTMTELTDFCKVWFSHVAECFDPANGEKIEDDNPQTIWAKTLAAQTGRLLLICFKIVRPDNLSWREIVTNLRQQGYLRLLAGGAIHQLADLAALEPAAVDAALAGIGEVMVIQDRLAPTPDDRARFIEAIETALHFGRGEVHFFSADGFAPAGHYSRGLRSPQTGRLFRAAAPVLFSFNSPLGACPKCRGFGRVIDIDWRLALPDQSVSLDDGAIKCWESEIYGESKDDMMKWAKKWKIPTDIPFSSLTAEQQAFIIDGEPGYGEANGKTWPEFWYGVKGFFRWLEKNTHKMHVRVFLSRYRIYNLCPDCGGQRLQREALCWKWRGHTLPQLYQMPSAGLLALLANSAGRVGDRQSEIALDAILTRLRYLDQVGLGHLTLDRQSRTLSGGEVQRVNLTSCLGTSLVDTLFVLDEPSVGLHPRDIDRLIAVIRSLTDAGNTVVVVEHDEAMIRAADHVVEVGPEPGARGGRIVFQGTVAGMLAAPESITGAYLSGRETIDPPAGFRPAATDWLVFKRVTKHNLIDQTIRFPLGRLVALSGVSGSGKSTLLDNVIYQGLLVRRLKLADDPAEIGAIEGDEALGDIVLVDQSPVARTPRSNPALYSGAWESIRELFARTPEAKAAGFGPSSFSFNGGDGRCDHCLGRGYERVEMQFLSDVFVPCPVCEGSRFKPEVLAVRWNGRSVADLLATGIDEARPLFADHAGIQARLADLAAAGLGYLTLGQPLNTLSGGEAQRLKLVRYLGGYGGDGTAPARALLLLDEPTTGLHRHDVKRLLAVLRALVDRGHSVVVIEHQLDVLKSADWLIEIGPEAGALGGRIVAEGSPAEVARAGTATSPFLRRALDATAPEGEGDAGWKPALQGRALECGGELGMVAEGAAAFAIPGGHRAAGGGNLEITGARENNLKNLSVSIAHRQLTVVTGVSGSGKSTLAFDIVFAEGQRRFMESMSPYARQFVEQLPRPAVDRITGIPPTVAIEQRVTRGSRKSTVATITEVAQYLRLLYARVGIQHHPDTDRPVVPLSPVALRKLLLRQLSTPQAATARHLYLCAPVIRARKGHHEPIAKWIAGQGYELMRADGKLIRTAAFQKLDRYAEHDIEAVIADLKTAPSPADALETALRVGQGACFLLAPRGGMMAWFSTTRTDGETGESFPDLDPKNFSFNSPKGWCPACRGHGRVFPWMLEAAKNGDEEDQATRLREFGIDLGSEHSEDGQRCPLCHGERLNRVSRAVKLHFNGRQPPLSLPGLLASTPAQLLARLAALDLDARGASIARDLAPQIGERLAFLDRVGLGYLSLDRPTETLSGGEAQRIRLAAQLGSNLTGVLYVLDEPSIGLHARDNDQLIGTLEALRDKGNTVLVVEHDEGLMARANRIIDLGPAAGVHGGELLAEGTPAEIKRSARSLTGLFLARGLAHPLRGAYRTAAPEGWLELRGASFRNLKNFDLRLPLGRLIMVAGPSGSGKSTLCRDLLHPAVAHAIKQGKALLTGRDFVRATGFDVQGDGAPAPAAPGRAKKSLPRSQPVPFLDLRAANVFKGVIEVDQAPIGKTPRSTPATYLGIFDLIRQYFAGLPESKLRGYTPSRFSFNTSGGRCPTCEGAGRIRLEMAFMPDVQLPCDDCGGLRYGPDLAEIRWKGKNIGEVLQLTFEEATAFFDFHSKLSQVCQLMTDCGLGYLTLGQSSPTLSGGEAQRLKLVTELSLGLASYRERSRGLTPRNLYLLEEPTIGLHLSDCEKLIKVLHSLVEQGHTVVVIEHHLDLLAEADYIVELGPVGGPEGGELLYQGNLAGLLKVRRSPTAPYLGEKLNGRSKEC